MSSNAVKTKLALSIVVTGAIAATVYLTMLRQQKPTPIDAPQSAPNVALPEAPIFPEVISETAYISQPKPPESPRPPRRAAVANLSREPKPNSINTEPQVKHKSNPKNRTRRTKSISPDQAFPIKRHHPGIVWLVPKGYQYVLYEGARCRIEEKSRNEYRYFYKGCYYPIEYY